MIKKTSILLILLMCFSVVLLTSSAIVADNSFSFQISSAWGRFSNPMYYQGTSSQGLTFPLAWPPLVWMNPAGDIVPWFADDYEISEDATVYTFHLPKNATWTDGVAVTAADFDFTFHLMLSDTALEEGAIHVRNVLIANNIVGFAAFRDGEAERISGINAIDDYTFQVELIEPNYGFLLNLARYPNAGPQPKHILGEMTYEEVFQSYYMNDPDVFAGPYKFVEFERGQHVILEARTDGGWPHQQPQIERLYGLVIADGAPGVEAALEREELDFGSIRSSEVPRMSELDHLIIESAETAGFSFIYVNTEKIDQKARQAITHALNREVLRNIVQGDTGRIINTAITGPDWAVPDDLYDYNYDPQKARELLAESSLDTSRTLEFYTTSTEVNRIVAQFIQESLRQVGLTVNINMTTFQNAIEQVRQGNFDFFPTSGGVPSLDPHFAIDYFTGTGNLSRYYNEELEVLAAQGARTSVPEERQAIYHEASRLLNQEVPAIFLYQGAMNFGLNTRIQGFEFPISLFETTTGGALNWYIK